MSPRKIVSQLDSELFEKAKRLEGKTIKKIEYGRGERRPGVHQTEVLNIEFVDGERVSISLGSNAMEFKNRSSQFKPDDFCVDFIFRWNCD